MIDRKQFDDHYRHMENMFKKWWFKEYITALEKSYSFCAVTKKSAALIDVGCHAGAYCLLYGKYFNKIVLSDIVDYRSTEVVDSFPFYQFSLDSPLLPVDIGEYDLVNCLDVLEHIPDENRAIRNLSKLIRQGGYLLLSVPNRLRIAERIKSSFGFPTRFPTAEKNSYTTVHYREYSVKEIIDLLQQFYFKINDIQIVIAGIGSFYFPFYKLFPATLKKSIVILAEKKNHFV